MSQGMSVSPHSFQKDAGDRCAWRQAEKRHAAAETPHSAPLKAARIFLIGRTEGNKTNLFYTDVNLKVSTRPLYVCCLDDVEEPADIGRGRDGMQDSEWNTVVPRHRQHSHLRMDTIPVGDAH